MARTVSKVILLGRLGADAVTSSGATGGPSITCFSVATDYLQWLANGDAYESFANSCDVAVWGAGELAPLLTKGSQLYREGRFSRTSSWDGGDGDRHWCTEVLARPSA